MAGDGRPTTEPTQMTLAINVSTFVQTEAPKEGSAITPGTVEVTLQGKTRRVSGYRMGDTFVAFEMVGKYQSGSKLWPGSIHSDLNRAGERYETLRFGFDSRSGKHTRKPMIWFKADAPASAISKR
jgi:hypothetical protein